ncbi:hypothetical protein HBI25_121140 [Parastagonospora nodorum]|nr:hypothetical protein HBH51_145430 [Parastagonospora nodorum]KAH3989468.1 hypothetical protein HBH52_020420 [Parastagonospora nodorum]KAH3998170.1 hypothetical protein HBI10_133290 [Parastagonospora nodorum]KAH4029895.1 hypothetical protein HBI13_034310 [Parastagonospora nodorum]KAH4407172.1 hypothetical protein HBH92_156620 [Parastagonospora nodorum]
MSSFKLDPTIFNATLYAQLTDLWLPNVDSTGSELDPSLLQRWFSSDPALDRTCRDSFAHALEAIGPENVEPSAQPFFDEIERAGDDGAWTALSLAILLDQMPRNIYRTDEGLRKVYTHYDPMAYNLSRALLSPDKRVDLRPQFRHSIAHRMWLYMPLMHSEDIEAHKLVDGILADAKSDVAGRKGSEMMLAGQLKAEKEHREILDRFGRYPHRNGALGRVSTEAKKKFIREGGATFGVKQARDEL